MVCLLHSHTRSPASDLQWWRESRLGWFSAARVPSERSVERIGSANLAGRRSLAMPGTDTTRRLPIQQDKCATKSHLQTHKFIPFLDPLANYLSFEYCLWKILFKLIVNETIKQVSVEKYVHVFHFEIIFFCWLLQVGKLLNFVFNLNLQRKVKL